MNYFMKNDENGFSVVEKQTGLIIKERLPRPTAQMYTSRLNKDWGFAGWTPEFVSRKIKTP